MTKSLTKVALASGLLLGYLSSAQADSELDTVTIYGKANISLQSSDDGEGSFTELKSNASRIGFKGRLAIAEDIDVFYRAEFEVDMDGDEDNVFEHRNIYVGFHGWFGELYLGRNDSALKQSVGRTDIFNDLEGDIVGLFVGENRPSNSITYKSSSVANFRVWITYIAPEQNALGQKEETQSSYALVYGDSRFENGPVYLALSADVGVTSLMARVNGSLGRYDVARATGQVDVGGGFILGGIYHTQKNITTQQKMDGFNASLRYVHEAFVVRAQYQSATFDQEGTNAGLSLGFDYTLNERAKLYAFYSGFSIEQSDLATDYDPALAAIKQKYAGFGVEYYF
ncbi:porin [Thalassotalea agarivorans]|nr:porin [Thalassotalea agarivorans]